MAAYIAHQFDDMINPLEGCVWRRQGRKAHIMSRLWCLAGPITPASPMTTAYAQPHPRFSVLSNSSLSSSEPTGTASRFSLPSAPSINTALATPKPTGARPNIYDRNLNKTLKAEVSASAFAFLFSEMVQYTQKRVSGINDLERRYSVSSVLLEHD